MSKQIKLYTKTATGTIVNVKNCKVLLQSLPSLKTIVERISQKDLPIVIYTEKELFNKIDSEVRRVGSSNQENFLYEIFFQSTNYIPIILIGIRENVNRYISFKAEQSNK